MSLLQHRGGGLILTSFVAALALSIVPLPDWLILLRPEWVAMVVIYWCMALPQRIGVGIAWLAGLLLDVVRDVLLGQYALTLAVIAFIVIRLHQRLRVFPLWQQAVVVAVLIVLQYFLVFWVRGTTGELPDFWLLLLPALGTFLLWPPTFLLLRNLRRRYQVT